MAGSSGGQQGGGASTKSQKEQPTKEDIHEVRFVAEKASSDAQQAINAVSSLSESLDKKFSETMNYIEERESKWEQHLEKLHNRISETKEEALTRGQPSSRAILTAVLVFFTFVGGMVQYVRMSQAPLEKDVSQNTKVVRETVPKLHTQLAVLEERTKNYQTISDLKDKNLGQRVDSGNKAQQADIDKVRQRIESLRNSLANADQRLDRRLQNEFGPRIKRLEDLMDALLRRGMSGTDLSNQ
jgi:hypothetical protein